MKIFGCPGSKIVVLQNIGYITAEDGFVEARILLEKFQKLSA